MNRPGLRRLLVANFFPAFYPPRSGGEQRYFHLYEHLSSRFDVTLVSATFADHAEECIEHSPTFREWRVPKHPDADGLHVHLAQQGIGPECSGYVVALLGAKDGAYAQRFAQLATGADAIVHDCPFTVPYDPGLGRDSIPRIYNAYNVEADLAAQTMQGEAGAQAAAFITELEAHLVRNSALLFACSEDERQAFIARYAIDPARVRLAPNGYDERAVARVDAPEADAGVVFLGSQHPPNVEALGFIAGTLAPALPDVRFDILGGVCKAFTGTVPSNVRLRGFVEAHEKSHLLSTSRVAINPLFSGAGTNLKMLDYMAHGAPVVATAIGARGLDVRDGEHLRIAAAADFAIVLREMIAGCDDSRAMGERARLFAESRYAWDAIATSMGDALDTLWSGARDGRRRIVWVCDYPVAGGGSGGQVRARHLLAELGREFDVTLLCLTEAPTASRTMIAPNVVQLAIPKTDAHRAEDRAMSQGEWISVADIVAARRCLDNAAFVAAFDELVAGADLVGFEQCYLAPLATRVPARLRVVHSTQNHEASLKRDLLAPRADAAARVAEVEAIEQRMMASSHLAIAVSHADAQVFRTRYPDVPCVVVENGVDVPAGLPRRAEWDGGAFAFGAPLAVFIGSGHPPNARAARFIARDLAPATPHVLYAIVGSVCDSIRDEPLPANMLLLGFLADNEKAMLLGMADLAVNPLFEGGGSSLKVPDFFACGLPTVSSSVGMRGYHAVDGEHYVTADPAHFADAVARLVADRARRTTMGPNAWRLVRRDFDWGVLGGKLRRALRPLTRPPRTGRTRVLAVTYRFGNAARGGAETFLANVLSRIAADPRIALTIAATDVGAIRNQLMFSAHYEAPGDTDRTPAWAGDVLRFPVDPAPATLLEDCRRLYAAWIDEARDLGRTFLDQLPEGGLAGGWHYPEPTADGDLVRWTSAEAQVRIPKAARRACLVLSAPSKTTLTVRQGNDVRATRALHGDATIEVDLAPGGGLLTIACDDLVAAPGDPRALGVLAKAITFAIDAGAIAADMRHELEILPHRVPLARWVEALVALAERRGADADARFLAARGPNSLALERWLDANLQRFDAVLVQGVPFATVPMGVERARRAGVPVVALPHAHIEDRFYHWRAFYDAYRGADRVIAAPAASVPAFFAPIGARAVALPGGGVSLDEFAPDALAAGRRAFRAVYAGTAPFVLVLGRKADGKNYRKVLDAHARLVAEGGDLDLVMIGPDDDGAPVSGARTHYLGPQAREVVVGAAAEARVLATMSESESFGIVLLEAWLAGTPVIASARCAAFAELVRDGDNGRLVATGDALVDALRDYLRDPALADRHAAQGADTARSWTWDHLASAIAGVLSDVSREDFH